jgi:hypothetical protein
MASASVWVVVATLLVSPDADMNRHGSEVRADEPSPGTTPKTGEQDKPATKTSDSVNTKSVNKKPAGEVRGETNARTEARSDSDTVPVKKSDGGQKDALLDKLLNQLAGETPEKGDLAENIDRAERAISSMREVEKRLGSKLPDKSTVELQQRVIDDLQKLIDELLNPPQQQPNQNESQDQQNNSQQDGSQKQFRGQQERPNGAQPESDPMKKLNPERKPAGQDGEQSEAERARQSTNRTGKAADRRSEDYKRQLLKDAWGHLPPALRDELLNVGGDRFLPKYEELVRRYYQSLAEKNLKPATNSAPRPMK